MKEILHLNLHRKFFAQIAAGTKRIEYHDWRRRPEGRHYDVVQFRNSYALLTGISEDWETGKIHLSIVPSNPPTACCQKVTEIKWPCRKKVWMVWVIIIIAYKKP